MDVVHEEQPLPVPSGRESVQAMVRADLEAREQVGIERYGTSLQVLNGRDAMRDLYEEALDLVVYLKQHHLEGRLLDAAMHMVWLSGRWRELTDAMGADEREAAAAAVLRHHRATASGSPAPIERDLRWWL